MNVHRGRKAVIGVVVAAVALGVVPVPLVGPGVALAEPVSYRDVVLADAPSGYWRLGEASGATASDSSGNGNAGSYINSPTLGVGGLITSDTDPAVSFAAPSQQQVKVPASPVSGTTLSVEAWFVMPAGTTKGIFVKNGNGYNGAAFGGVEAPRVL